MNLRRSDDHAGARSWSGPRPAPGRSACSPCRCSPTTPSRRAAAAGKEQRPVDRRGLIAAGFVLLVTTLDPATWPPEDVLALYRCRRQIGLLFTRLEGIWHLDRLRAREPEAAQAHLLAVLLAALPAGEVRRATAIPRDAWRDDPDHPLSRWRWEALRHDAILQAIRGPFDLLTLQRRLARLRRHLCDSPRRRPLQATGARALLRSHAPHQEQRRA